MQIQVGYTKDEVEKVSKAFTVTHTYNSVVLKEDTSMIRPTFIISTVNDFSSINYMYVPQFKRYYYVNNVVAMKGGRIALECEVDVLMSFASDIRKSKALIDKQESSSLSSAYINDGSYVLECRDVIQNIEFPNGFTNTANIIITAGG